MEAHNICARCRWWQQDDPEYGKCRRHAPKDDRWPDTNGGRWCGEWQSKEPTPDPAEVRRALEFYRDTHLPTLAAIIAAAEAWLREHS